MTHDQRIETAAKAAYEKFNENLIGCCEPLWGDLSEDVRFRMKESVGSAIAAYLGDDVVVPKAELSFVVFIAGRNEASPVIDRVHALLSASPLAERGNHD